MLAEGKTVLIVDDAYFMRKEISRVLKEAGYEIVGEAKNGKEGVKLFFELEPDIVTMDINMPEMDGIEATRQILSKVPDANIIAVTGSNSDEVKEEMMKAGAKAYLKKPFQPAFLLTKIESLYEEPKVEEAEELVELVEENTSVIDDDNEDDFFSEEIELLNEPVPEKERVIIVQNEDDLIEFPEEYPVEEKMEEYALTKEKLEELSRQEEQKEEEIIFEDDSFEDDRNVDPPEFKNSSFQEEQTSESTLPTSNDSSPPSSPQPQPSKPQFISQVETESSVRIKPPRSKIYQQNPYNIDDEDEEVDEPILNNDSSSSASSGKEKKGLFSTLINLLKK